MQMLVMQIKGMSTICECNILIEPTLHLIINNLPGLYGAKHPGISISTWFLPS